MNHVFSDRKACATCVSFSHELCKLLNHLGLKGGQKHLFPKTIGVALSEPDTRIHYHSFIPIMKEKRLWIVVIGKEGQIRSKDSRTEIIWLDQHHVAFMPAPCPYSSFFIEEGPAYKKEKPFSRISRSVPSKLLVEKITASLKNGTAPLMLSFTGKNSSCRLDHLSGSDPARKDIIERSFPNLKELCPKEVVRQVVDTAIFAF